MPVEPHTQHAAAKVYFVAHNRNHVRILLPVYQHLKAEGYATEFAIPFRKTHMARSAPELERLNIPFLPFAALESAANPGDLVVVGIGKGPAPFADFLQEIAKRNVRTVGVVDGCRFAERSRYQALQHVLVWGQSGKNIYKERAKIVGAPMLEATRKVPRHNPSESALINFKFLKNKAETEGAQDWIEAALNVCKACNLEPIISSHPSAVDISDIAPPSQTAIEDLLGQHDVLITRCSTTIYQALLTGAQPFVFPLEGEKLYEFKRPHGAFSVTYTAEELQASIMAWRSGALRFSPQKFLGRHLSLDERKSATQRIAEELMSLCAEQ